ncbi:hypothetical protein ACFL0F_01425 [Patescibacteria group bacterium]
MKKLLPIVLVIAVISVGAYILMNRSSSNTSMDVTPPDSSVSDSFTGSLMDAVKLGVAMKCTYTVEGNEYESYIKGKNYRGKIKTAEGKTGEVIIKDNCMWTWAEEEAQGIKTCFVEEPESDTGSIWEQPQGAIGPDMSYTCLPSTVTDAEFTPPSNIDFMDIDSMMEGFGN